MRDPQYLENFNILNLSVYYKVQFIPPTTRVITSLNMCVCFSFTQLEEMTGEAAAIRDQLEQLKVSHHDHDRCGTVKWFKSHIHLGNFHFRIAVCKHCLV